MHKYKPYEEFKEELGSKFEEYMYKSNIELLNRIDKTIEYIEENSTDYWNIDKTKLLYRMINVENVLEILKGDNNE